MSPEKNLQTGDGNLRLRRNSYRRHTHTAFETAVKQTDKKPETYPMKRTTALTATLMLSLVATSLPAVAQDGGEGPRGPRGPMIQFEAMDANNDGKITQDEIDAHAAARFAETDTNGDGTISIEEMVARMTTERAERIQKGAERMIERRDANNDGVLSADEMGPRNGNRMFERLDANSDGAITKEEMEEARERFAKRFGEHRKGERGGHWKQHKHGQND